MEGNCRCFAAECVTMNNGMHTFPYFGWYMPTAHTVAIMNICVHTHAYTQFHTQRKNKVKS